MRSKKLVCNTRVFKIYIVVMLALLDRDYRSIRSSISFHTDWHDHQCFLLKNHGEMFLILSINYKIKIDFALHIKKRTSSTHNLIINVYKISYKCHK